MEHLKQSLDSHIIIQATFIHYSTFKNHISNKLPLVQPVLVHVKNHYWFCHLHSYYQFFWWERLKRVMLQGRDSAKSRILFGVEVKVHVFLDVNGVN